MPDSVVLSAGTLGWLMRAAEAADGRRRSVFMGQTEAGLEAMARRASAAELRRDTLWTRLKDAEKREAYYRELAKKDGDFQGTWESHRRLRADIERLFDAAQTAYDAALGGYLLLLHESERPRPEARPRPATAPPRTVVPPPPRKPQGAAWPLAPSPAQMVPVRTPSPATPVQWGGLAPWALSTALRTRAAALISPFGIGT